MAKDLIIIGGSGFGREVANLVNDINVVKHTWNLLGLIDDNLKGSTVEGLQILGGIGDLHKINPRPEVVVAIADTDTRCLIVEKLSMEGYSFATLIHPSVTTGKLVGLGEGTIVCANTLFTTNIDIG
ncbi:MAG TPA: transferase, partial [Syntrophomonadaceae bacterium]|nr:transferase [Syntrophomonadaceae bacterium]